MAGNIRKCSQDDVEEIYTIINDGAQAYRGVIPADRLKEPYMSRRELQDEIADGVVFWGIVSGSKTAMVLHKLARMQY